MDWRDQPWNFYCSPFIGDQVKQNFMASVASLPAISADELTCHICQKAMESHGHLIPVTKLPQQCREQVLRTTPVKASRATGNALKTPTMRYKSPKRSHLLCVHCFPTCCPISPLGLLRWYVTVLGMMTDMMINMIAKMVINDHDN